MFSFSFRWLWAQCLAVSAGFFLLGHLALPNSASEVLVAGQVSGVAIISRKGLGSFYELAVQADSGEQDRVLLARNVGEESVVRGLVGHRISARVNWSSEATDLETDASADFDAHKVHQSAAGTKANYDLLAIIFAGAGMAIGLVTLALRGNRQG